MIVDLAPTYKQHLALELLRDDKTKFIVFGGGGGGGKSWNGCVWLITNCYFYPGTRYYIGREELKRLKDSTLMTFFKVCAHYKIPASDYNYNGTEHYITFKNGSRIDLLDLKYLPSDPLYERYGSTEYTSGWIEEAGEVHYDAFDTLKSRVGRHLNDKYNLLGKTYITCNPKRNWLYNSFYKPSMNGTLPEDSAFIQALVTDNEYREKGYIEALQGITNKAKKERLLHGNWNYEDEPDQLIPYEWLDKAIDIKIIPGKKCLGVDVARYGDDSTVLALINGNCLESIETFNQLSIDKVADVVKIKIKDAVIDSDRVGVDVVGLGAGVADILKRDGFNVTEISSGEAAIELSNTDAYKFNNLRSQMWWTAREELRTGELAFNTVDDILFEDLTAPKYEISGDKTIKVESKKSIKERIGRSPDKGDAFIYANWLRKHRGKSNNISVKIF